MALRVCERSVDSIRPVCLPTDQEESFAFAQGLITDWGYTETTKKLLPRPLTSDVLREAEIFILPQVSTQPK